MKRCVHCETLKAAIEFPPMLQCRDGLSSWCRECHRTAARQSASNRPKRLGPPKPSWLTARRRPAPELSGQTCPVPWSICRACDGRFIQRRYGHAASYCSDRCEGRAYKRSHPKPHLPVGIRRCQGCGTSFIANASRKFCRFECGQRTHRLAYRDRQRAAGYDRTAPWERVFRRRVFDRDGWVCQICFGIVDDARQYPDPMSPSMDHIVPLIRGGRHTYSNVQLAHLQCNEIKGAA
jgi:5-methylcytosine-specific restriction endonuclease McrA